MLPPALRWEVDVDVVSTLGAGLLTQTPPVPRGRAVGEGPLPRPLRPSLPDLHWSFGLDPVSVRGRCLHAADTYDLGLQCDFR
jgi:hypothetical protein